jgi:hypothetical protein
VLIGRLERGIACIYHDEVDDMCSLLHSLRHLERTIHPITDARVLLMQTQKLLRMLLSDDPDIDNVSLLAEVHTHGGW